MPDESFTREHGFTRIDRATNPAAWVEVLTSVDNVMGLRTWARAALARGLMSDAEVLRWETLYDQRVAEGRFRWSVSFFITSGRKPARSPA